MFHVGFIRQPTLATCWLTWRRWMRWTSLHDSALVQAWYDFFDDDSLAKILNTNPKKGLTLRLWNSFGIGLRNRVWTATFHCDPPQMRSGFHASTN